MTIRRTPPPEVYTVPYTGGAFAFVTARTLADPRAAK